MAFTGQTFLQRPQPTHFYLVIWWFFLLASHTPAGHTPFNHLGHVFIPWTLLLILPFGCLFFRGRRELCFLCIFQFQEICLPYPCRLWPLFISSRSSSINMRTFSCREHNLPQDSFWVKSMKNLLYCTMHYPRHYNKSSGTYHGSFLSRLSKFQGQSSWRFLIPPPELPPICTALNPFPSFNSAPISNIMSFNLCAHGDLKKSGV